LAKALHHMLLFRWLKPTVIIFNACLTLIIPF
jgi:hypothetical protein